MIIREYTMGDLKQMIMIWNEIVDEGIYKCMSKPKLFLIFQNS